VSNTPVPRTRLFLAPPPWCVIFFFQVTVRSGPFPGEAESATEILSAKTGNHVDRHSELVPPPTDLIISSTTLVLAGDVFNSNRGFPPSVSPSFPCAPPFELPDLLVG